MRSQDKWLSLAVVASAFLGAVMSTIGFFVSLLDTDVVLAAITLPAGAVCGALWTWHVVPQGNARS